MNLTNTGATGSEMLNGNFACCSIFMDLCCTTAAAGDASEFSVWPYVYPFGPAQTEIEKAVKE